MKLRLLKWSWWQAAWLLWRHYQVARRYGGRRESAKIAWALTTTLHKGDARRYALVEKFKLTGKC